MAVLIKCPSCGQIKKYGEWVRLSEGLEDFLRGMTTDVLTVTCERCEEKVEETRIEG